MDYQGELDRQVGENLRRLREGLRWSQTDLARALGEVYGDSYKQQTIAKLEHGDRPLRLGEALALMAVFQIDDPAALLGPNQAPRDAALRSEIALLRSHLAGLQGDIRIAEERLMRLVSEAEQGQSRLEELERALAEEVGSGQHQEG
jgi:transcriptional regulator with XRE-family HTH domain